MVATQNIDTLGPIWTFSLRGVLTFVASDLDINGCVLSYFEGTANLHCYTSCTLTTLHCSKLSFLQCCHMKRYNKIFTKMWGVYSLLCDTVFIYAVNIVIFALNIFIKDSENDLSQGLSVCLTTFKMAENLVGRKWKPLDFNSTELGIIQPIANYCKSMIWIITSQTQPLWYMLRYRFWTEETLSQRSTRSHKLTTTLPSSTCP